MRDRQIDRCIQFLRISACLAVFICHFGQRLAIDNISNNLYSVSQLGRYGVELFFVISGYLVCFSLKNRKSVIQFYKKRIIRIMPLYYFCILYYFLTETFIFRNIPNDSFNLGWLRYIFCLNGIVPSEGYFWSNIGITWTIPVFMLFYLVAPLLVRCAKSTFLSALMLGFSFVISILVKRYCGGWFSSITYLPCFIFGIFVFNAKNDKRRLFALLLFQLFVFGIEFCDWSGYLSKIVQHLDLYVVSAIFASIILFSEELVINNRKTIIITDLLDEYSYTLYLVHGLTFCGIIDKIGMDVFNNLVGAIAFRLFIAVFITGLLTFLIHRFYEKPIQKVLSKILLRN